MSKTKKEIENWTKEEMDDLRIGNYFWMAIALLVAAGAWAWIYFALMAITHFPIEKETWYPGESDVGATEEFEEMLKEFEIKVEE